MINGLVTVFSNDVGGGLRISNVHVEKGRKDLFVGEEKINGLTVWGRNV